MIHDDGDYVDNDDKSRFARAGKDIVPIQELNCTRNLTYSWTKYLTQLHLVLQLDMDMISWKFGCGTLVYYKPEFIKPS